MTSSWIHIFYIPITLVSILEILPVSTNRPNISCRVSPFTATSTRSSAYSVVPITPPPLFTSPVLPWVIVLRTDWTKNGRCAASSTYASSNFYNIGLPTVIYVWWQEMYNLFCKYMLRIKERDSLLCLWIHLQTHTNVTGSCTEICLCIDDQRNDTEGD